MRFRKLRIAWSVGCGIACVLLIALWMRSYRRVDNARDLFGHDLASMYGAVVVDDTIFLDHADEPYRY